MRDTSWKRRMFYEKDIHQDNTDLLVKALDAAVTIAVLLALLALYSWVQSRDAKEEAIAQREVAEKATGLLAECMNGGALFDNASDVAYFCDKPLEVQL